ncbi:MAG: hypothetical protein IT233_06575 [Bacteroidia bacterium]|nr:hypothetical protein [Bacteroidia bacterium]
MPLRFRLLIFVLFFSGVMDAQSKKDSLYNPKQEIIYQGNKYRVWNNWLSGGFGYGMDVTHTRDIFWLGLDYNFHIKWTYFQLGFFLSGRDFGDYDNTQIHGGIVKRKETTQYNLSAFGGGSWSTGFPLDSGRFDVRNPYEEFGIYAGGQAIYKLKYDIGIGFTGIINYNAYHLWIGARIDIYFSGAYKGRNK